MSSPVIYTLDGKLTSKRVPSSRKLDDLTIDFLKSSSDFPPTTDESPSEFAKCFGQNFQRVATSD